MVYLKVSLTVNSKFIPFYKIFSRLLIFLEIAEGNDEIVGAPKGEICKNRLLKDIAIVEIYFGSPFVTKYKRDVQTTFTGKISNVG